MKDEALGCMLLAILTALILVACFAGPISFAILIPTIIGLKAWFAYMDQK